MFEVKVVESSTGEVVEVLNAIKTERQAEKVERGLLINMNRDLYHTEIEGCENEPPVDWY